MTKTTEFEFDQHPFALTKEEGQWTLVMKKSDVLTGEAKDLALLTVDNTMFLPSSYVWKEDSVTFHYEVKTSYISFSDLQKQGRKDKLRCLINLGTVKELLHLPLSFFIHPENIVFDSNLLPKIAYRGLLEKCHQKLCRKLAYCDNISVLLLLY